jgi:hypothetical protein
MPNLRRACELYIKGMSVSLRERTFKELGFFSGIEVVFPKTCDAAVSGD